MLLSIKKIEKNKEKILEDLRKKYNLSKRDYILDLTAEKNISRSGLKKEVSLEIKFKRKMDLSTKSKDFRLLISRLEMTKSMTQKKLFLENCRDEEEDDFVIDLNRVKKEILEFKDLVKADKEEVKLRAKEEFLDDTQLIELIQIYHRSDYKIAEEQSHNIQRVSFGDVKYIDLIFYLANQDQKWFLCAKNKYNGFSISLQITDISGLDVVCDSLSFSGKSIGINQTDLEEPKTVKEFIRECDFISTEDSLSKIGQYIAKNISKKDIKIDFNQVSLNKKFNLKDIMDDL